MRRLPDISLDVVQEHIVITPEGCWSWTGRRHSTGYARYRGILVHRWMWAAYNGPIPEGYEVDHACHEDAQCGSSVGTDCPHRLCVNPDHLRLLTSVENKRKQYRAWKTHCVNGHEFTPENTYYRPDRYGRMCKACGLERQRAAYKKESV